MSDSKQKLPSNFQSEDEAFEFLIQQSQNQKLKDQWKVELEQLPDAPIKKNYGASKILLRTGLSIAAILILVLGAIFMFRVNNDSLQHMAESMIQETKFILPNSSETRGVNDGENELTVEFQKEIDKALETKDYKRSIELFARKEGISALSNEDKFFYSLSLSRVDDNDLDKAIQMLEDVIDQKNGYYDEALWLKALLHLKNDNPNESKIVLNKLINNSNYQITNSKALLERMAD